MLASNGADAERCGARPRGIDSVSECRCNLTAVVPPGPDVKCRARIVREYAEELLREPGFRVAPLLADELVRRW